MTPIKKSIAVEAGSGNVFADLGPASNGTAQGVTEKFTPADHGPTPLLL